MLCIAAVIIAILVLALVGAIHLIVLIVRGFDRLPAIREAPHASSRQELSSSLETNIEQTKLRTTLKTLLEFRDSELIDEETFQKLHQVVSIRQQRLRPTSRRSAPVVEAISEVLPADLRHTAVEAAEPPREATPVAVPESPRPRRSWGELLSSFMEERHILWGELVGGLLIVGCSAALVLSLWQTLQQIPMFPFLILAALTSAMFGVGRYTLQRWRLEATSRGLVVIALLLVPLNFMVLAGLSASVTDIRIELATKFIAVPLFAWLVYRAGTLLFSKHEAGLLALAVVGAAVSPLPVPRLFEPESLLWLLPAIWAVACFGAGMSLFLRTRWEQTDIAPRSAWETLGFLGLTTFPLLVALIFTGVWAGTHDADLMFILHRLSLPIVLAGVPVAATGLMVQQRSNAGPLVIAGTCVALIGILIHGEALFTSWPQTEFLILVGLIIAAAWTAGAIAFRIPLAHAAAMVGLTTAAVATVHVTGPFSWPVVLTSKTGIALAGLSLFLAVVADQLRWRELWNHGRVHAAFAAALMACGLILVGTHAGQFPWRAAAVGATAIVTCLILEQRWGMPMLGQIGACLAPVITIAVLHALLPGQLATWGALLATEAIALTLIRPARRPAVGLAVGLAVLFLALFSPLMAPAHAATFALLALVAVLQAHQLRIEALAWVGSGTLLLSLGHWLYVQPETPLPLAAPLVFLIHATMLLPALLVRRFPNVALIGRALGNSAKVSSLIAAGALAFYPDPTKLTWLTAGAGWVAVLWLAFAVIESRAGWYSASQAATAMTAVLGISAALRSAGLESQILGSLDLYALTLAGLVAIWTALRLLRRHPIWDAADWPAFERVMLGGLIVATAALAIMRVAPNVVSELASPGEVRYSIQPFWRIPGGEWLVLSVLAIVLAAQFWVVDRTWQHALALTGMLTIYLVIPALAASYFNNRLTSASALRWGLGAAFLFGCIPFWYRDSIVEIASRLGIRVSDPESWNRVAVVGGLRFALLAVAGGVPLLLTLVTMGNLIAGHSPAGPGAGTVFHKLGFTWSHGLPLAFVAAGMVGHALRDRSSEYAFGAGLLVKFLVCGGFLVAAATAHRPFDEFVWIEMAQRFAITAGAWAIGWLIVARWLGQFQNADRPWLEQPSVWWNAQFTLAAISTLAPLLLAATFIAMSRTLPPWILAISAWPEWLALILALVAIDVRSQFAGKDHVAPIIGVGAMAAAMLLAASIPMGWPGWAFRPDAWLGGMCPRLGASNALETNTRVTGRSRSRHGSCHSARVERSADSCGARLVEANTGAVRHWADSRRVGDLPIGR